MTEVLTRFAPAPTGLLHLGHVANAIYVWGLAARRGAEVLLRIEDHDQQRSRAAYEHALLDDLDWLGFVPDRYPTDAFRRGPCESRQSDRHAIYDVHARSLGERGLLYGCGCSRAALKRVAEDGAAHACREHRLPLGGHVAWRLSVSTGTESFDDLLAGPQLQTMAFGIADPVIRDRAGNWTYQFAVVIDDWLQGIDLVVRGRDLLESTALQLHLGRLVGRPSPATFAHHPLIMKSATRKLSKSDGDSGVRALRDEGWSAADVVGLAAWRVGLVATHEPVTAHDVSGLFA